MTGAKSCYWCRGPLPALPADASYVDEINHCIHDGCREQLDESNARMEELRAGIVEERIEQIPNVVRQAVRVLTPVPMPLRPRPRLPGL